MITLFCFFLKDFLALSTTETIFSATAIRLKMMASMFHLCTRGKSINSCWICGSVTVRGCIVSLYVFVQSVGHVFLHYLTTVFHVKMFCVLFLWLCLNFSLYNSRTCIATQPTLAHSTELQWMYVLWSLCLDCSNVCCVVMELHVDRFSMHNCICGITNVAVTF